MVESRKSEVRDHEDQDFATSSGITIEEIYDGNSLSELDYERDLNTSGEFPFTRGPYEGMYRTRIWTRRFQVGFGSPLDSNQRIKYLHEHGANGFVITIDLPTSYGFDSDDPIAAGEVGVTGLALSTLEDMETLYDGFGPDSISYALSIRPPVSSVSLAMLACVAEDKGVDLKTVIGTQQNDPFFQMSGGPLQTTTQFFPLDGTLRLCLDNIEFITNNMPRLNWMVTNGYNLRETGVNAIEDGAFVLSHAFDIFRMAKERSLDINLFPRRASFFLSCSVDFFEEIAKFRAMRRLYARKMRDELGATDDNACRMRFSVQTAGNTLTRQQAHVNIVRGSIEALAAVFGGAQSLHLCSYDEGHGLPTEESSRIALRTQQVLAYETGVTKTIDPLAGSYYVEHLTNELEARIRDKIAEVDSVGGMAQAVQDGWLEEQINGARYNNQQDIDSGKRSLVGVNCYRIPEEEETPIKTHKLKADEWGEKRALYLNNYRQNRNLRNWKTSISDLKRAWLRGDNMIRPIMNALRNKATMGEIHEAMRDAQDWSFR